ncbi:uncharacterized protein VTP21DRAFT_7279 [Calcarisporiella thermophila]|uniref:uncharacterized protein n=1 Tax=Calcarisporiella thermophila TaxID=911321 RepID=UPI0037436544
MTDANDSSSLNNNEQPASIFESKVINEEYKIWKKNAPYLYDLLVIHALEWPSLTCQWLPGIEVPEDKDSTVQKLLLGTHTSGKDENHLLVAGVYLPKEAPKNGGGEEDEEEELHVRIEKKIAHPKEVNRARYLPQRPNIVATRTSRGDVLVYDWSDPLHRAGSEVAEQYMILRGHSKEGYGMSWHKKHEGILLTGSDDTTICQWDINKTMDTNERPQIVEPLRIYHGHTAIVEDVSWHPLHEHQFASVGDDHKLLIWDSRTPDSNKPVHNVIAHNQEINCVAFNPTDEYLIATGSVDSTVALWDIRHLKQRFHTLMYHKDEILQLEWSPHHESVLATGSGDRRVAIWDLGRAQDEPTLPEETEEAPSELLFVHGGHTNRVTDLSWHPEEPWMMASVAEDNTVQIWQMASRIYSGEDEEIEGA